MTCRCDCGVTRDFLYSNLVRGRTRSCGCKWLAAVSGQNNGNWRHGGERLHPAEHRIWSGMVNRCTNANNYSFAKYGGRGIRVCERWVSSFANFLADMGERPSSTHSIDRIDVNGHYEPSNCRWATPAEQARNKRNTILTIDAARDIRRLRAAGTPTASIANEYGVSGATVSAVTTGRTWRE